MFIRNVKRLDIWYGLDKNRKNPVSVSESSTALYECKAVARCATRKTDTAINRIKTLVALKLGPPYGKQ